MERVQLGFNEHQEIRTMWTTSPKRPAQWLLLLFLLSSICGCTILGVAASKLPPPTVEAKYTGLAGQSVGVMVWADLGVRIDWPSIQIDLANAIQKKLQTSKAKEVKGATFPVQPASIVRWQQDHPESEGSPITMIAPKLGVSRLIYVELEHFATRSDLQVDLFRGEATATVKVVEVESARAEDGFTEPGVTAFFPPKAPREGVPNVGDQRIYAGTIDALATQIANRFLPHTEEE